MIIGRGDILLFSCNSRPELKGGPFIPFKGMREFKALWDICPLQLYYTHWRCLTVFVVVVVSSVSIHSGMWKELARVGFFSSSFLVGFFLLLFGSTVSECVLSYAPTPVYISEPDRIEKWWLTDIQTCICVCVSPHRALLLYALCAQTEVCLMHAARGIIGFRHDDMLCKALFFLYIDADRCLAEWCLETRQGKRVNEFVRAEEKG